MHVNHLNHKIVRRILLDTVNIKYDEVEEWKTYLPLLAVCSYWRDILEPVVYSIVFVKHDNAIDNHTDNIHTNMQLFTSPYLCNIATVAIVDFKEANNPYTWTSEAIRVLANHPYPFLSARVLMTESMYADRRPNYESQVIPPKAQRDLAYNDTVSLAGRFIQQLPNIYSIDHHSKYVYQLDDIYKYILGYYLPRAHRARLYALPILMPFDHWSPQITHMNIKFSTHYPLTHFPLVNSKSLKSLTLYNILKEFTFGPFADADQYSSINFNNLEELSLIYNGNLAKPMTPRLLHFSMSFPKLKKLALHSTSLRCDAVYAKSFPKLEFLKYSGTSQALCQLALAQYGSLVYVYILSPNFTQYMADFYSATNNLVSKMDTRFKTKLIFDGFPSAVKIANIKWKQLKSLVINSGVQSFSLVCELLKKLSLLEYLCFRKLNVADFDISSLLRLRDRSDYRQYILSSQLEHLGIYGCAVEDIHAISYLVICCPAMVKVSLKDSSYLDKVYNEVSPFVVQYPHLADMKWIAWH